MRRMKRLVAMLLTAAMLLSAPVSYTHLIRLPVSKSRYNETRRALTLYASL